MPVRRKARCSADVLPWVRHSHQHLQNTLLKRHTPTRELDLIRTPKMLVLPRSSAARSVCVEAGCARPLLPVSTTALQATNYDAGVRL